MGGLSKCDSCEIMQYRIWSISLYIKQPSPSIDCNLFNPTTKAHQYHCARCGHSVSVASVLMQHLLLHTVLTRETPFLLRLYDVCFDHRGIKMNIRLIWCQE